MKSIIILTLASLISTISISQQLIVEHNGSLPVEIRTNNTKNVSLYSTNGVRKGYLGLFSGENDMDFGTPVDNPDGSVHLTIKGSPELSVINNGNVGIGVTDPDAKLEIDGQVKITGGSPGTDKVLVSDANGLASWAVSPPPPPTIYAIGDFAQGGVVFWVSPSGEHGKVVSIYDIGPTPWSDVTNVEIGATAQSDINGAGNTVAIILQDGQKISAAQHCNRLTYGGYDDWYLPSKDELNLVYLVKSDINPTATANGGENFATSIYWSSSEFDDRDAWAQFFSNGLQISDFKTFTGNRVRAIRAF